MSYTTPLWLKKPSLLRSPLAVAGLISICVQSSIVSAEQDWWFDVEVIVFKRNVGLADISEKFPLAPPSIISTNNVDLLSAYLTPDLSYLVQALPICNEAISPPYLWGPTPLQADQSVDANLSDEDVIQIDEQLQVSDSAMQVNSKLKVVAPSMQSATEVEVADSSIQVNTEVDSVDFPTKQAPQENIDDAAAQTVSQVDIDDSYSQDPVDMDLSKEETETTQDSALFTEANIIGSFVNFQFPERLPCAYPEQLALLKNPFDKPVTQKTVPRVPIYIDGIEWIERDRPYLLPQSLLTLSDLYADISRQQDLLPLLHLGWRQEVLFGEDKALPFRLFAGENFADRYSATGELLVEELVPDSAPDENYHPVDEKVDVVSHVDLEIKSSEKESLFAQIDKVLADDTPITIDEQKANTPADLAVQQALSTLWELDGKLKVYLQYVGRTPYLHIDTNLEYRSPVYVANKQLKEDENNHQNSIVVGEQITKPNYLQSVQFDQLRRVISKQLHYFDHPLFGMIVHITRYNRPEPEPEPELDDSTLLEIQITPDTKQSENK